MEKGKDNNQVLEEMRKNQFPDRMDKFWEKYTDKSGIVHMPPPEEPPRPRDGDWWGQ